MAEHSRHFHPLSPGGPGKGPCIFSEALKEAQDGEKVTSVGEDGADHTFEPIREEENAKEVTSDEVIGTGVEQLLSVSERLPRKSSQLAPPTAMI